MLSPAIAVPQLPAGTPSATVFHLAPNRPNPFGTETVLVFSVPSPLDVRLSVFDVTGRLVTTLLNDRVSAGRHEIRWDGRNGSGSAVAPGVYFYRVDAGPFRETRRMVRLR